MKTQDPTGSTPERQASRRLLVLVGGPFPGAQRDRAAWILARAQGADVLVVAPRLPVPGERWLVDLDARQARAHTNLRSWIEALAGWAESVRGQTADESPRLAVADTLDGFEADEYLDALVSGEPAPAQRRPIERLRDLVTAAPAPPRLRTGQA